MAKKLTKKKAKIILTEGSVRGKKLTKKQKGFFGAIAGGAKMVKHPAEKEMMKRMKLRHKKY